MAAETQGITENSPAITWSDREILLHILQHLEDMDARLTFLEGLWAGTSQKVDDMHAELEAARPLLERAMRNRIVRYAAGMGLGGNGHQQWPT